MELTADLIAVQSVLTSLVSTTGEFAAIKYKGGNEHKIKLIIEKLEDLLNNKGYIKNKKTVNKYKKELQDITFFLIINTEFKTIFEIKECLHLINIIPKLSQCLLANIVIELDLGVYYFNSVQKLPLNYTPELLNEFIPCLKRCNPAIVLTNIYIIEHTVIKKLKTIDNPDLQMEEIIDKVLDVAVELLTNLSGFNPDQIQNWKSLKLYIHMGHTLLNLLELISCCTTTETILCRLVDNLLRVSCSVMQAVTVDVFCAWAEIDFNEQSLQSAISSQAYTVIDKFQKYKPAKELVQMLGTIARKPKPIKELVLEADLSTIIKMIRANASNQQLWFQALLNTQVFDNDDAKKCVTEWAHLCTLEDVGRLFSLAVNYKKDDAKEIVLKCASILSIDDLVLATLRHFHKHGIKNCFDTGKVQQQITLLLNKFKQSDSDDFLKNIHLLVLQNPEYVFMYLFTECMKNSVYCDYLKNTFKSLKEINKIDMVGLNCLIKCVDNYQLNFDNKNSLIDLLNMLIETNCLTGNKIIGMIIKPRIEKYIEEENSEELLLYLQVFNGISLHLTVSEENNSLILLFTILKSSRCKFFEFSTTKSEIVKETVLLIEKHRQIAPYYPINLKDNLQEITNTDLNKLNKYYYLVLFEAVNMPLWDYIYPNCDFDNHADMVSRLIQILPRCVTSELLSIFSTLVNKCGIDSSTEIFTDALILLRQAAETQKDNTQVCAGLKYCLQHYGIIIKNLLETHSTSLENEVNIARCVVRLLLHIANILKQDGLSLVTVIPERALKSLVQDKSFVCLIATINDADISKILAQKMLN